MTEMEIGFMLLALLGGVCSWAIYLDACKDAKMAEEREAGLMDRLVELDRDNDDLRADVEKYKRCWKDLENRTIQYASKCLQMEAQANALADTARIKVEDFPSHSS